MKCKRKWYLLFVVTFCNCITYSQITGIKIFAVPCNTLTLTLQVTGTSTSPYFSWNFGDPLSGANNTDYITGGSPSPNPVHTFTSPGVYTVTASFQEAGSTTVEEVRRTILVGSCCSGQIISAASTTCNNNNIPFSVVADDTVLNVSWDFNDPSSGGSNTFVGNNATHTFSSAGNYLVTATITAGCGVFTASYPIVILPASTSPNFNLISTICEGDAAPALPTTSLNSIVGIWSPPTIDNNTGARYVFIPDPGQCATNYFFDVTVTKKSTPQFQAIAPICVGAAVPLLPTTSLNGIDGTWVPPVIDARSSATYIFTPNAGQCATTTSLDLVIVQNNAVSFDYIVSQPFEVNSSVTIIPNVPGNYLYQLDDQTPQNSNIFLNLSSGIHQIAIYNTNACSDDVIYKEILIVKYPKFFTPNGDGYNDTWNISDLYLQKKSKIYIFDRYGKLLKQLFPSFLAWDGTYNGNLMPSDDYWFTVEYEYNLMPKYFKGHFSLKR